MTAAAILEGRDLTVEWRQGGARVQALRGVSVSLRPGQTVGVVGESGSGKSTLIRALLGLAPLTHGEVRVQGQPWSIAGRRLVQPVLQDPSSALDPRLTVAESLAEPFAVHRQPVTPEALASLLETVRLDSSVGTRLPHQLSLGQRQRVSLARALALSPQALLLDEPVSALDVSVQAQILNLLMELRAQRGLALLLVSHDLDVVAHLAQRLLVIYAGRVVEEGDAEAVLTSPRHPYTRALLDRSASAGRLAPPTVGEGCPFAPRCSLAVQACRAQEPALEGDSHRVACPRSKGG